MNRHGCMGPEKVMTEVERLRKVLEGISELAHEEECDCPPEWPRCVACRIRLRIHAALGKEEP